MNISRDFSKQVNTQLRAAGYSFYNKTWLAGSDGSYANGHTGYYLLDSTGKSILLDYQGVLDLAEKNNLK